MMWLLPSKVSVRESGMLDGFCDCHCHLLPGVDDGVRKTAETLQILQLWAEVGVCEVWLTPHIMEDIPNEPAKLEAEYHQLLSSYSGNIKLHLAAEHTLDGLFVDRMADNLLMPIFADKKHLLVETSYFIPPMNMDAIMDAIKKKGYQPILAHPERYQYMDYSDYRRWKDAGVLLQLNVPSLVGAYGPMAQKKAQWLFRQGMYDYCGSDTHSLNQVELFLNSIISRKTAKMIKTLSKMK